MRTIVYQRNFKRDYKKFQKSGRNMARFVEAIKLLQQGSPLPSIYRDHQLSGNWKDFNECHLGGELSIDLSILSKRVAPRSYGKSFTVI